MYMFLWGELIIHIHFTDTLALARSFVLCKTRRVESRMSLLLKKWIIHKRKLPCMTDVLTVCFYVARYFLQDHQCTIFWALKFYLTLHFLQILLSKISKYGSLVKHCICKNQPQNSVFQPFESLHFKFCFSCLIHCKSTIPLLALLPP